MKNKIQPKMSVEEIAALVSEALKNNGIDAVLTGGAVVSIYSDNEYQSYDLDYVIQGIGKNVDIAMNELGFKRKSGRHFKHTKTEFFVEFPSGPLAIGNEPVKEIATKCNEFGTIRLLPPTECVMDRLAAFYFWNDEQCLDQAVIVAKRHSVKIKKIENWSDREGMGDKFKQFLLRLKSGKKF